MLVRFHETILTVKSVCSSENKFQIFLLKLQFYHFSINWKFLRSYIERSTLFVKEQSLPQTAPTNDAFFNRNWAGACWNRWAGPLALDVGLLCKNKKQEDQRGTRPLPLRCLSQFFPKEKINCLESEFSAYVCISFTDGVVWYL